MDDLLSVVSITAAGVAEAVHIRLGNFTPRLTGFASAGWLISLYRPGPLVFTPGSDAERLAAVPTARRLAASTRQNLAAYDVRRGNVFVSNTVRYILALNAGSSRKAPANFVQAEMVKAATDDSTRRKIAQAAGPGVTP